MTVPYCRHHRKASELPPSELTRAQKYETPFSPDWERVFEERQGKRDSETTTATSTSPGSRYVHEYGYARGGRYQPIPYTEAQALMEAAPMAAVQKSHEEGHAEHERIVDAIDGLDSRSRWIFDAIAIGGKSYRIVGKELNLSKTQIDRIYKAALLKLQTELKDMVD